jgi:anti-sigma regulatory factor (Ser/Thr protein kinase)
LVVGVGGHKGKSVTTSTLPLPRHPDAAFRHEAMLYAGSDDFLAGTSAFIRAGVAAGDPMLVVVSAEKIAQLRAALGIAADMVHFADMADVGANPARIIPAWRRFVDAQGQSGRPMRGIGEPIWASRTPAELIECQRHEDLLNVAFDAAPAFWLLCPYDVDALPSAVIEEAHRSHPYVMQGDSGVASETYRGVDAFTAPFDAPLPLPPADAAEMPFDARRLANLRDFVAKEAAAASLPRTQTDDLVLAVNEVAVNSLRYGGGGGTLRVWRNDDVVICEIEDGGHIDEPLAGRQQPALDTTGGRGLWLVNHLCDLVQMRSAPTGTVIRMHVLRAR